MKRMMMKNGILRSSMLILMAVVSLAATHKIGNLNAVASTDTARLRFDTVFLTLNGASEAGALFAPAISLNPNATEYVEDYIADNTELLQSIKAKSARYFRVADQIFSRYHLPQELKYLAVVESELKMSALSKVGARGPWQLMPETARLLSLKVDGQRDDRTHYYKSTVAAALYLRDLHGIFKDWLLTIAAYNSGPGKVFEAIRKSGSRNFWQLQAYLPAETRGHVKKFVATHYYFEGKGSVATLTREEVKGYREIMLAYVAGYNNRIDAALGTPDNSTDLAPNKADVARVEPRFANVIE